MKSQRSVLIRSILLGGVLPVVAFSVIEDRYGSFWGTIAGLVFGVGEILYEWRNLGRVETMTWVGNGMLFVLGGLSIFTQNGIWFKLQPSILEAAMAALLIGSVLVGRPFLTLMMKKQGLPANPLLEEAFKGLSFRIGIFFGAHSALAAYAAFYWSTAAWAILKGVGFTLSMVGYMVVETLVLRYRLASSHGRTEREILHQNLRLPNERGGLGADGRVDGREGDGPF